MSTIQKIQIKRPTAVIFGIIAFLIIVATSGGFTPTPTEKAKAGEIDAKAVIESQQSSLAEAKKKLETELKIKEIESKKLDLEKSKIDLENSLKEEVKVSTDQAVKQPVQTEKLIDGKTETPPLPPVDEFVEKAKSLGIHPDLAISMKQAADEFKTNPRYLLTIVLSENATSPHQAVGDNGCSFGAYQGNGCAGKGRWGEVWFGLDYKSCMKDYLCSSKWVAYRIVNQYCRSTTCSSWIGQLSKHNGDPAPSWYSQKIEKNGLRAGLTY